MPENVGPDGALVGIAESTVASAATCDIGAAANLRVAITGTTGITSFGTKANRVRFLRFAGALLLTHNAASLILPHGVSIMTAAGDTAVAISDASGNWRVVEYVFAGRRSDPAPANLMDFYGSPRDLSGPAWTRSAVTVSGAAADPDGLNRAQTVFETAANAFHDLTRTFPKPAAAKSYKLSGRFKAAGRSWVSLSAFGTGYASGCASYFDVTNGVQGTTSFAYGTFSGLTRSITALGGGWFEAQIGFTTDTTADLIIAFRVNNADADGVSYAGDPTKGVQMWDLDVREV